MGAPALLGLLPQGGLIQASKEVGFHHNKKGVELNIPHKKIPIWSVMYVYIWTIIEPTCRVYSVQYSVQKELNDGYS